MLRTASISLLLLGLSVDRAPADDSLPSPLCPAPIGGDETPPLMSYPQESYPIDAGLGWALPFVRDTRYGARPTAGAAGSPSNGYDHYELPSKHYGLWYRPSSAGEDNGLHCQSRAYSPRGFGWANRRCGFEIDYHPYVVKQVPSVHGPSYYYRQPLTACPCWLRGCQPGVDGQH